MADYWHNRYLQTLSKIDQAQSAAARSAYMDLAIHYKAMRRFCERAPDPELLRRAA